jgi:RNA polymerase sigma factor (TIGR02999 family)
MRLSTTEGVGLRAVTEEHEITRLLRDFRDGDRSAFDRLFEIVYDDLRRRARFQLRQVGGASLATTGLVHEAYLKLASAGDPDWQSRGHFYRVAARAMRQIVIDRARRHQAAKRGGGNRPVDIDDVAIASDDASEHLVALDHALNLLEAESPNAARIVELTYFTGLSVEEAADVFGVSTRTVKRLRQFGRAFLHRVLADGADDSIDAPRVARTEDGAARPGAQHVRDQP